MINNVAVVGSSAYILDVSFSSTCYLGILDVSDPANPVEGPSVDTADDPYGLFVTGGYAYITDWQGGELRIVDLSAPGGPAQVGFYDVLGYNANDVFVVGTLAYVATGSGFYILNVSNPGAISQVYRYRPSGAYFFSEVVVVGDYAYLIDDEGGYKMWVIDVSTPTLPYFEGDFDSLGSVDKLVIDGNLIYIAGETQGLNIYDITNPAAPTEVGSFNPSGMWVFDVEVDGNFAYLAAGNDGMRVVDISNPATPTEVNDYATSGTLNDIHILGDEAYLVDGRESADCRYHPTINAYTKRPLHHTWLGNRRFGG